VAKINELLKDLRERDEALIKAHNDMKFYKLELVNREESYNKVFGRQPTVQTAAEPDGTPIAVGKPSGSEVGGFKRTKSIR
jgi:hypothetical protein